jgi:hypothetical protein
MRGEEWRRVSAEVCECAGKEFRTAAGYLSRLRLVVAPGLVFLALFCFLGGEPSAVIVATLPANLSLDWFETPDFVMALRLGFGISYKPLHPGS